MIEYSLYEQVAVLTLKNKENRFNPAFIQEFMSVLDEIETHTDARSLVVCADHEKIFCNGIDVDWLIPLIENGEHAQVKDFLYLLNRFFKRTLTYPMITIAALTGHVFAGGAIWACAFDFRFMRSDRGYFCLPEVDLGIPFLPGMLELLKKAIPLYKLTEMHHTGVRLTAEECQKHHIINRACHMDTLMDEARIFAKPFSKKRSVLAEMKIRLYKEIIHALDVEDVNYIESEKLIFT